MTITMETSVDELGLSTRARNVLADRYGSGYGDRKPVVTVGELVRLTESELRMRSGCGAATVNEIRAALKASHMTLGMTASAASGGTLPGGVAVMSLRDWFAGQALPQCVVRFWVDMDKMAKENGVKVNEAAAAETLEYMQAAVEMAYHFADAMLAKRVKP